ncbi:ribosomal protein L11 methyltransferase [Cerasibacillus quisquiliarum]|uniref:Ribosomal protein L11 methyltransferase n=2 Tax=Cerasibacillus quisquiliarum TaxID=227865 RepID=A0A511UWP9_9BACI|nr:ribosomal protein L11 methyltransferase [Cerasibacillus quisquiliarum]
MNYGASGVVIENRLDIEKERETKFGEIFDLNIADYPEEGVFIKAYFSQQDEQLDKKINQMRKKINQLPDFQIDIGPNMLYLREVAEKDWATAWKKYYDIVHVSEHVTIVPSWDVDKYEAKSKNEKIIKLDPGMAFGTGTHPTTKLSIQALEKYIHKQDTVIDVGSGSGVLSIASVLLGAKEVFAYDLDPVAVKSTKENIKLNGLEHAVFPMQKDLLKGAEHQADLIVSNILAEIIVQFIEDAWNNLTRDGIFITSGIINEKRLLVENGLEKQGFKIIETNHLDDWVSIVAKKQ